MRLVISLLSFLMITACSSIITLESDHPISLKERYLICAHDGMQHYLEEVVPKIRGEFAKVDIPVYQPGEFSEENTSPMLEKISLVLIQVISEDGLQKKIRRNTQNGSFRERVYQCTKHYNIKSARSDIISDVSRFFWVLMEYNEYSQGKKIDYALARHNGGVKLLKRIYLNSDNFNQFYWNYFEVFADEWIEMRDYR